MGCYNIRSFYTIYKYSTFSEGENSMKKRVSLLLTMIMCCSVFTGCSSSKSENSTKEVVKEVKNGGVVKEAISEAPSGVFVPTSFTFNDDANINSMIYEGLVTLDENLDVKPCLAESY